MTYYVYEYLRVEGRRTALQAVVHLAECRACNHGRGYACTAGVKRGLYRWHGPFRSLATARRAAEKISGQALSCKRCCPF